MAKNGGGPFHPQTRRPLPSGDAPLVRDFPGLSLRDWFAGQALAGWLASFGDDQVHPADGEKQDENRGCPYAAASAYKLADAMLAARGK